jgi:peptidoglycan/xylan/chitin deacetylase (PgdA/CDA1 family)
MMVSVALGPMRLAPPPIHVPILVYHAVAPHTPGQTPDQRAYDVAPESFEAEMAYLRDRAFVVVSFGTFVTALDGGRPLPARSVVITFDDGWISQYRHAVPVLRRFGYTATFFVFTNPIGKDDRFMTWDQLRELSAEGMTIGSHSWTHPMIASVHDPNALRREVDGSRVDLEKRLDQPIAFFAYPFGRSTPDAEAAVRAAGYSAARAFPGGAWNSRDDLWHLRSVMATDNLAQFRRDVEPPPAGSIRARTPRERVDAGSRRPTPKIPQRGAPAFRLN